jgi:hypothetical protein
MCIEPPVTILDMPKVRLVLTPAAGMDRREDTFDSSMDSILLSSCKASMDRTLTCSRSSGMLFGETRVLGEARDLGEARGDACLAATVIVGGGCNAA